MEVSEAIRTKRAVRQFTAENVPDEVIKMVLNAGRRAQSSKNTQPWTFIVVRDRDTLEGLSQCGGFTAHVSGADFAVALVASENNLFDLGQAAAYLQLAAWEEGIGSCLAAMWEEDKAKEILGVPPEMYFRYVISFGYPSVEAPATPKPGGRKSFEEVVRWEKW